MGDPPAAQTDMLMTAKVDNNFFAEGLYHLRINFRMQNSIITNNDLGLLTTGGPHNEFGLVDVQTPGQIITWSNNKDGHGNIVNNPNP
jgi:hypothetical protein